MGEKPVFACKAHVFTIDPQTKQSWLQHSQSAVDVNVFWDPNQCRHRIVSISEGKKVIINSNISEKMNFRKTSQKFGQWADSKQSTLYGLGFASEMELDRFVEHFNKFVEEARQRSSTGSGLGRGAGSFPNGDLGGPRAQRAGSLDCGLPAAFRKDSAVPSDVAAWQNRGRRATVTASCEQTVSPPNPQPALPPPGQPPAPAPGPAGAKFEEVDLMNALEESQHREAELRHTLQVYTDECSRLGAKVKELEAGRCEQVDNQLSARIDQMHLRDSQQGSKIKHLESENARLKARVTELEAACAQQRPAMEAARVKLRELSDIMDDIVSANGRLG